MDRLDPEKRAVLLLRARDQLPYEAIAAALDIPVGTVMSRLARARNALLHELAQTENDAAVSDASGITSSNLDFPVNAETSDDSSRVIAVEYRSSLDLPEPEEVITYEYGSQDRITSIAATTPSWSSPSPWPSACARSPPPSPTSRA